MNLLILYVVAATFGAALTGRDMWPFSSWALMVGTAPRDIGDSPKPARIRVAAVDTRGIEYPVDYRVWQPLNIEELGTWWHRVLPTLAAGERVRVGAFLLSRANQGWSAVQAGRPPGYFHRFLGPLVAPSHTLHPTIWSGTADLPPEPFVRIRLYREYYNVEARRRNPHSIQLVRVFEFPGDP
ncbi:MAG TPA: hypothetical protein VF970_07575 [Gemmatimonadales bacterium]